MELDLEVDHVVVLRVLINIQNETFNKQTK